MGDEGSIRSIAGKAMNRDDIQTQLRSVAGIFRTLDLMEAKIKIISQGPGGEVLIDRELEIEDAIEGMRATMRRYRESLNQQLKP